LTKDVNRWLVLALVSIAQFMVILDATIVNVALPSIQDSLDFSSADLQWVINGYTLLFGGFLLLGGRAGDLFGRQRLFVAGLTLFTVASLVNGLATSSNVLIAGRAAQGLGAALVSPAVLSILMTAFSEGRERARALGLFSAISTGGGAAGLLLGGVLTDALSWRWVFYVNVPVGIAGVLLALRFVPDSRAERRPAGVDIAGATAVTGGLLALVFGIVKAQDWGWTSGRTLGVAAVAVALLASFVAIELRSREPLVRLGIFAKRSLSTANVGMLLLASGMFAMFYFMTLYLQEVLGYSPIRTGFAFLPLPVAIAAGAGIGQVLMGRVGVRTVLYAGLALGAAGMFLLSGVPTAGSYAADLLPGFLVLAVGLGLAFPALILIATTTVTDDEAGLASGLVNTSQQVGGALGLAALSTFAASRTSDVISGFGASVTANDRTAALVDGFQRAYAIGGFLMVAALVIAAALIRRSDTAVIAEEPEAEPAFAFVEAEEAA
jgi:EmrB/QacA subfamily drug resistance transporter